MVLFIYVLRVQHCIKQFKYNLNSLFLTQSWLLHEVGVHRIMIMYCNFVILIVNNDNSYVKKKLLMENIK